MLINGVRELAFIAVADEVLPIEGADNIELIKVLGWTCIIKKGEIKKGEKCVYIEIDSLVPSDNPVFAFLAAKHFKVKTFKLGKFGVVSQGLALPLNAFPELGDPKVNTPVTEKLGITYSAPGDAERKQTPEEIQAENLKLFQIKHKKLFNRPLFKWLLGKGWFRKLLLATIISKKAEDKKSAFPRKYIRPTDEERIQNIPLTLKDKSPFVVTEKLDGTSTTFLMERKGRKKFEFYVCSRNRRIPRKQQASNSSVYWLMAEKYNVEQALKNYMQANRQLKWVAIQGETFGPKVQGNPLKLDELMFKAFNFITSHDGRFGTLEGKQLLEETYNIPWVPVIHSNYILPDTVEEMLEAATGPSTLNNKVLREGWVVRSLDSKTSFKAVSPEYLLKQK